MSMTDFLMYAFYIVLAVVFVYVSGWCLARLTALGAFRGDESAWRPEFLLGASSARAPCTTKSIAS